VRIGVHISRGVACRGPCDQIVPVQLMGLMSGSSILAPGSFLTRMHSGDGYAPPSFAS